MILSFEEKQPASTNRQTRLICFTHTFYKTDHLSTAQAICTMMAAIGTDHTAETVKAPTTSSKRSSMKSAGPHHSSVRKSVIFSHVEMREFNRVIGDHTDSFGPPLSFDWDHTEPQPVTLNDYEKKRGRRRSRDELVLSPGERSRVLRQDFGYSEEAIESAMKELESLERAESVRLEEDFVASLATSLIQKQKRKKGVLRSVRKGMMRILSSTERTLQMGATHIGPVVVAF